MDKLNVFATNLLGEPQIHISLNVHFLNTFLILKILFYKIDGSKNSQFRYFH